MVLLGYFCYSKYVRSPCPETHAIACTRVHTRAKSRSVAMGWHGVATAPPEQQDASFLPPLGIILQCFVLALSFSKGEISSVFGRAQP